MTQVEKKRYRLAVDIGGTFTDLALIDEVDATVWSDKVLTSSEDPASMVLYGLSRLMNSRKFGGVDLANVIHATTMVTNAIIEKKGAKTGFLTTKGFRDTLYIGREIRYDLYDLAIDMPAQLVARSMIREIEERIDHQGNIITPLVIDEVQKAARELINEGAQSLGIGFLHSFMHPEHEEQAEAAILNEHPQITVSISSNVAPEIRELERFSTTVANAYVQPLAKEYLTKLNTQLQELGVESDLFLMLSNGGVASVGTVQDFPIRLVESGPAAGVLAATFFGAEAGLTNIIAFDMGGTTAKICLVNDGEPGIAYSFEVARTQRFKKGSGLPIKAPAINLIEIGAGGGSIANVNQFGLLQVGPQSAGANPGPACYGIGGNHPTVTDADLLLGYLDPDYFLGGEMTLSNTKAKEAISSNLAEVMGIDPLHAAWGIHEVVNENMASAVRIHIAEMGEDPRKYTLVATGGAGPVHAYHVAEKLNIRRLICPPSAGVASSLGLLVAPPKMDVVRSYSMPLDEIEWKQLQQIYFEMEEELRSRLSEVGVKPNEVLLSRVADLRYKGQGHELHVQLPEGNFNKGYLDAIRAAFEAQYQAIFGRSNPSVKVEAINWRLFGQGISRPLPSHKTQPSSTLGETDAAQKGTRQVYSREFGAYQSTPVYDRYRILPDIIRNGPAVIEERESTVIIEPSGRFFLDKTGNLIIEIPE